MEYVRSERPGAGSMAVYPYPEQNEPKLTDRQEARPLPRKFRWRAGFPMQKGRHRAGPSVTDLHGPQGLAR